MNVVCEETVFEEQNHEFIDTRSLKNIDCGMFLATKNYLEWRITLELLFGMTFEVIQQTGDFFN